MALNPGFDLVQAAEGLLSDARRLMTTAKWGRSEEDELEVRRRITQTAKQIAFETSPPMDALKSDWVVLADVAACNLFMDWKAFDLIPLDGYISISDLAQALNTQESLVKRISSLLLSTSKLLPGPLPHTLRHSRFSPLYMSSNPASALAAVAVGNGMKPYAHWPEYFRTYGRREPGPATTTNPKIPTNGSTMKHEPENPPATVIQVMTPPNSAGLLLPLPSPSTTTTTALNSKPPPSQHVIPTPFSFAWGHPFLPPWEVKALSPSYATTFARSMKAREIVGGDVPLVGAGAVYDFGWVGEEARRRRQGRGDRKGEDEEGCEEAVVVDVGGGLGQLLRDVLKEVEGVRPEQCVLQDRGEVVEDARKMWGRRGVSGEDAESEGWGQKYGGDEEEGDRDERLMEGVVMMEHDFHGPQPVKGASVYLLRRILLDYSDEQAIGILRHLADALPQDNPRARVIIIEERLLDTPMPQNRIVDLVMLNLGGKLRNEAMFGEIAAAAGLKMVGYHAREGDAICVVEYALA